MTYDDDTHFGQVINCAKFDVYTPSSFGGVGANTPKNTHGEGTALYHRNQPTLPASSSVMSSITTRFSISVQPASPNE